jgi:double-stranded uracil-DNA glycosylase
VDEVKTGLAPIVRADARLLILGSLPGDRSLSAQRYYAHSTNQFWKLLGGAIGEDLHALGYEERLERLGERGIGLWDVIGSARRRGSLDQAIREPAHNALADFVTGLPGLQAIAFNGGTAASTGRRLLAGIAGRVALIDLPSSSAAFTRPLAEKGREWSVLMGYCRPPASPPE